MSTVVIAGAGPTGLALACGLAASGVRVRLLEKREEPALTSRALGLQPRGAEVLDRLGALADLPDRSVPVARVVTHVNGTPVADLPVGRPTPLVTRPGLLISQAEIEASLRHRLRELGCEVEWGKEIHAVAQDASGVSVSCSGEKIRSSWLIGCDGAHSRVRKAAGIGFPGVPVAEDFLLADVRAPLPLPRDAVSVWLRADSMLGAFPLPGDGIWRLMAPARAESVSPGSGGVPDELTRQLRDRTGLKPPVAEEVLWSSRFRIHRRLASTYRSGRVLLAGDAAHIHSPFGGQGMNTGLGDAENLAWKLALVAHGAAPGTLLDTYEAERRPVAREVLASTSSLTRLVVGDTALARAARDRVFVPLMNRPLVQRLVRERSSQLRIHYRGGPLGARLRERWAPGPPRAGDRVPDLVCRHPDGSPTRLHAELGARWALLIPGPGNGAAYRTTAERHLGPETRVIPLVPCTAGHRCVMLVRPDGHLAWRGSSAASLDAWLRHGLGITEPHPPEDDDA
ncbi:FAD-dependent monooxygenase [Streptomyces meridianus]|uniref:FAD-dependent monooxygenase n=1 Tax=Streptomyces meridianus TaxID=2938945 RepID=A0ABT0X7D9_9ACTN|nr:FAD-dependent monooxygenase [Streptomyces meridianus]MCM2578443.1 FAD-dependent monooxygenase [Streptomyces meridianus]